MRCAQELILALLVCCGGDPPHAEAPHSAHWSYDDIAHWEGQCGTGKHQSPIDLPASAPDAPLGISASYAPLPIAMVNNGHTIQVDGAPSSSLVLDGVRYELAQFHFHSPSEHTLAGKSFDAEIHFVHKSADGKAVVIGVFATKGKPNAELAPVFDAIPRATATAQTMPGTIDLGVILPKAPRYARYDGSLTTPPCSEGVGWFVETSSVLEISDAQLATLRARFHGDTRRPVQALGDRTVVIAH